MEPQQNYPEAQPPQDVPSPPAPPLQDSALQPPQLSQQSQVVLPPPRRRHHGWIIALFVLLLLAGGGAYAWHHHSPEGFLSPTPKSSVTLYYSDGKTILWQDNNPAVEPTTQPPKAPYFVDMVRAELHQKFGDNYYKQGAWAITTTLDASLQRTAEKLVADNLSNLQNRTHGLADAEATILQDVTTGQIKALVGGPDRANPDFGQLNFATSVRIAPGSSIEPFDYAALIENTTNTGAGTSVADTQTPLPGYPCTNKDQRVGNCLFDFDFLYPGNMPLRYALGGIRNVPAVQAGSTVGVQKVIDLVKQAGATSGYNCYALGAPKQTTQCYQSSLLGEGAFLTLADETHALSTLANAGKKLPQTTIASVTLNSKAKGAGQQPVTQVIKPDTAYIINDTMSDPNASYLPGSCDAQNCSALSSNGYKFQRYNGWKFAVDSGTTNSGYNAVMASWSSRYAVVSWVGNHSQNVSINKYGATAEQLTIPLTRGLMEAAHAGKTASNWKQPSDIKTLPAFVLTKHIHFGDVEPSPTTDLYPAWYKP